MTEDELEELLAACPTLYHMASDGAWESIREDGLRSTTSLLNLYGVVGERRSATEDEVRRESIRLECPGRRPAVIRDQCAMSERALNRVLEDDLEVRDWCRILNGQVFFWLTLERLEKLLGGKKYRAHFHDVLEVDSASLVRRHRDRVRLSPYNSGTTLYNAPMRGRGTFLPIADFPYRQWKDRRSVTKAVAELTVDGQVEDILEHTVRVVRRSRDEVVEERYVRT